MESHKRLERRYFYSKKYNKILIEQIVNTGLFKKLHFKENVTETVYFTLNDSNNSLYSNFYIRIRIYKSSLLNKIEIDNSEAYLEIKNKNTDIKIKKRITISANEAVKILTNTKLCVSTFAIPAVYPFSGTQVKRLHWELKNLRITIDPETYFFVFSEKDFYTGVKIGKLNEGKIEFKYNNLDLSLNNIEKSIINKIIYHKENNDYLERRMRECIKTKG